MTVKVDLSRAMLETDWPTHLSQEQRTQLIEEKFLRARVYHYVNTGEIDWEIKEQLCSQQTQ